MMMEDLPDECLALIFPFLSSKADRDAAALTCRRWRTLDALTRHTLIFSNDHTMPSASCELLPADKWPELHLLLLQGLHSFPCINCIGIHPSFIRLSDSFFALFQTTALARLLSLHLGNNTCRTTQINDEFIQSLVLACPALEYLNLSNSNVSDAGLLTLAHGCRHLRSLVVGDCAITDIGIDAMHEDMQEIQVFNNPNIIGWGFRNGKNLTDIFATGCDNLTEAGLAEGLQGVVLLQELDISYSFPPRSLPPIVMCCKRLVKLCISTWILDDSLVEKIAQNCSNLKFLDACYCDEITLQGWQALASSARMLEDLSVYNCQQFCEGSLLAIHKGCCRLRNLKISDCFCPPHPALHLFKVARHPSVNVEFYDSEDELHPLES